jgi:plasmid stabilization system protein ParE
MRLEFLPRAEQDLETIGDYIALDNPRRAASFIRGLQVQCRKLSKAPQAYRPRPGLVGQTSVCQGRRKSTPQLSSNPGPKKSR